MSWLPGCAMTLPPHSADISPPEQWRHTLSDGESRAQGSALDLGTWWTLFDERPLDELIAHVLQSNLQVREIAARVAAADALEQAADAQFRPSLQFATAPAETPDSRAAYLQGGVEAAWPLGLFGRAQASTAAAKAEAALTRTDAESARARILSETVRSYLAWRAANAASINLDARIAAQAERAALMRERVRLRLSAQSDLAAEEAQLEELRSARLVEDRAMTEASERLGLLTATADAYRLTAAGPDQRPITTPLLQGVPADLLRNRADVRQAEQAALRAAAQLHVAEADLYPQLPLPGPLTLSLPLSGNAGGTARSLAAVAPALEIPLFDWGRRRAIVTAQDHGLEAALLAYRESILSGVHEVEVALASLDSLTQDAELRRSALARADQFDANVATAARLGRASRLDILATTLRRLEAGASLASAEHSRRLAFVALCDALGGTHSLAST